VLIDEGLADPDTQDEAGCTPLHHGCQSAAVVAALLDRRADPTRRCRGRTALEMCEEAAARVLLLNASPPATAQDEAHVQPVGTTAKLPVHDPNAPLERVDRDTPESSLEAIERQQGRRFHAERAALRRETRDSPVVKSE